MTITGRFSGSRNYNSVVQTEWPASTLSGMQCLQNSHALGSLSSRNRWLQVCMHVYMYACAY